jgi:uncharacterized protein
VHTLAPVEFGVKLRSPQWAKPFRAQVAGSQVVPSSNEEVAIPSRRWKDGDQIRITYNLSPQWVHGEHTNAGREALTWGPLVLAYDESRNRGRTPAAVVLAKTGKPKAIPLPGVTVAVEAPVRSLREKTVRNAVFVPFAEAGSSGSRYQVWMREAGAGTQNRSLFAFGEESRSHEGNVAG